MNPHLAHANEHERLTQLLLDRALQGLDSDESAELHAIVHDDDAVDLELDPGGFEQAAALAAVAMIGSAESLPDALRDRLGANGRSWMRERPRGLTAGLTPPGLQATGNSQRTTIGQPATPAHPMRSNRIVSWGGWLAAAASLGIAILAWLPRLSLTVSPTSAELRARLLAIKPSDLVQWSWTATEDPSARGLAGDIIWSDVEQKGYMRFKGLAKNDPAREQYQLWIFDAGRKAEYPVDGGVFDITADGEVVIPIDPKLHIFNASMFAVTVEKPGGVARSDRERIPALAKPAE